MSRHLFAKDNLNFGKIPLQCVKLFNHLSFQISFNGKFWNLMQDRVLKATQMSNMILQAIGHNKMYL